MPGPDEREEVGGGESGGRVMIFFFIQVKV